MKRTKQQDKAIQAKRLHFGATIKQIRQAKGITGQQLAELTGIDKANMCRIEKGLNSPSLDTITKLLQALKCTFTIQDTEKNNAKG